MEFTLEGQMLLDEGSIESNDMEQEQEQQEDALKMMKRENILQNQDNKEQDSQDYSCSLGNLIDDYHEKSMEKFHENDNQINSSNTKTKENSKENQENYENKFILYEPITELDIFNFITTNTQDKEFNYNEESSYSMNENMFPNVNHENISEQKEDRPKVNEENIPAENLKRQENKENKRKNIKKQLKIENIENVNADILLDNSRFKNIKERKNKVAVLDQRGKTKNKN